MKHILISFMEFDDDRWFNVNKFIILPEQNHYQPAKQTEEISVSVEWLVWTVVKSFSEKKEIARGGRYDELLKSLGAKKNIPAVGAAINLNNIWKI